MLRANVEREMCDKCAELEGRIAHYERVSASVTDLTTVGRIKELVERLRAEKAALHPEQEQ